MTLLSRFDRNSLHRYLLCFVHIPKTAGTSFTNVLIKIIGQKKYRIILPEILHGDKEPDFDINTCSGISGHFSYEISKLILKPVLFLTFLRHPLSRIVSHFDQFQRIDLDHPSIQQSENYHYYEKVHQMTFEDFVEHRFFRTEVSNLQTRMLGLFIDRPIHQLKDVMPIDKAEDRFFSVELAKERLEQFTFFGLQEKFQESLDIFSYQFGIDPVVDPPTINTSSAQRQLSTVPQQIREKLLQLNKLDIELYEFAQKLFKERYDEMILRLQQEHQQADNTSVNEMLVLESYERNKIMQMPYHYEFEDGYQRSGWYPVERANGKMWIWSGPETVSTIDLPLDRVDHLRARFQVTHFIEIDVLESLEFRVDDQKIHLIHYAENSTHLFTGIIPANPGKKYVPTRLSFHVNRTAYPPSMNAESPYARLLGIALSWIDILPAE
jgi:Sulfotransferase family